MKKTLHYINKSNLILKIELLERANVIKPHSFDIILNLIKIYLSKEQFEDADKYTKQILEHNKCKKQTLLELARLNYNALRFEEANKLLNYIADFDNMLQEEVILLKAQIFYNLNKNTEALNILKSLTPLSFQEEILLLKTQIALDSRDFSLAKHLCQTLLSLSPKNVTAQKIRHKLTFKEKNVDFLELKFEYQKLIKVYSLHDDNDDVKILNNRLSKILVSKEQWLKNPHKFSTHHGDQLSDIFSYSDEVLVELRKLFEKFITIYIAQVMTLMEKYFSLDVKESLRINAWAVRLFSGGLQTPHTHPTGWISGVYYIEVPKFNDRTDEGGLEFVHKDNYDYKRLSIVQPISGNLVIFPSFYIHRTIPFKTEGQRICIAFDIVPFTPK